MKEKRLTKAEEQIMHQLWALEVATINQIIERLPDPKPAYNTVSTIVRILETKEFVSHRKKGKGYEYFPLISKVVYTEKSLNNLIQQYFNGSFKNLVSFFAKKNELDLDEFEQIMDQLNKKKS